jgi:hypothetical protein
MKTTICSTGVDVETAMNAVIIYDDLDLAGKVRAVLQSAASMAHASVLWHINVWRLDQLLSNSAEVMVLEDTAAAHLIVLAVRGRTAALDRLLEWMDKWAGHRTVQEAALAVFEEEGAKADSPQIADEFSRFAEHHGLGFVPGTDNCPAQGSHEYGSRVPLESRAPVVRADVEPPGHYRYQDWGLND